MRTLRLKRVRSLFVCLSLIQSIIACTPYTEGTQRDLFSDCSEATADASKGVTRTTPLTIAAHDFARRVVQLVGSIQGKDDISPETLNKRMGIQMIRDEKHPDYYLFSNHIAHDLDYSLVIFDEREEYKSSHLTFSYPFKNNNENPELRSKYALKFKELRELFLNTGYRQIDNQGSSILFTKKRSDILVFLYNGSGTDLENTYVKKLEVSVY